MSQASDAALSAVPPATGMMYQYPTEMRGLDAGLANAVGSQVGSQPLWTAADGCGRLWTPLVDLRIRRLGVRVPPGVLTKPLREGRFRRESCSCTF